MHKMLSPHSKLRNTAGFTLPWVGNSIWRLSTRDSRHLWLPSPSSPSPTFSREGNTRQLIEQVCLYRRTCGRLEANYWTGLIPRLLCSHTRAWEWDKLWTGLIPRLLFSHTRAWEWDKLWTGLILRLLCSHTRAWEWDKLLNWAHSPSLSSPCSMSTLRLSASDIDTVSWRSISKETHWEEVCVWRGEGSCWFLACLHTNLWETDKFMLFQSVMANLQAIKHIYVADEERKSETICIIRELTTFNSPLNTLSVKFASGTQTV